MTTHEHEGIDLGMLEIILGFLPDPDLVFVTELVEGVPDIERFRKYFPNMKYNNAVCPRRQIVLEGISRKQVLELMKSDREITEPYGIDFDHAEWRNYQGASITLDTKKLDVSYQGKVEPEFMGVLRKAVPSSHFTTILRFDHQETFYYPEIC